MADTDADSNPTSINPFLQEVLKNPDEDEARLVYADWLEEQGSARGDFIRAQCHIASSDETHEEYFDALETEDRLLIEHGEDWAAELGQDVRKTQFRRGFVDEVTVLASALVKEQGAIFDRAPIHWLRLNRVKGKGAKIAELDALTKLRGLDVSGIKIPEEDMLAILSSPYLKNLERFRAGHYSSEFSLAQVEGLAKSAAAESLKAITINADENLNGITAGDGFPQLETLALENYSSDLPRVDLTELDVPNLKSLELNGLNLDEESCLLLANLPWNQLEHFSMTCPNADGVLETLMSFGAFQRLRSFELSVHVGCDEGLMKLFSDSSLLTKCEKLAIEVNDGINPGSTLTMNKKRSQLH